MGVLVIYVESARTSPRSGRRSLTRGIRKLSCWSSSWTQTKKMLALAKQLKKRYMAALKKCPGDLGFYQ